ncbi:MAG: hypothetical protein VX290_16795 [Candidatus Latescibacterota bacterium]|nr:hypothetical protein [Candidatus Latescibacterota bacterium]
MLPLAPFAIIDGNHRRAVDVSLRFAERIEQQIETASSIEQLRQPALQRPLKMLGDNLGVIGQAAE